MTQSRTLVPPTCIDLKERFGDRYRVTYEDGGSPRDPWYTQIACQHGHIYPHGGDLLGAATDKRGPLVNKLRAVPGAQVVQDADDGANVVFPVGQFPTVARILKARRRRKLSPEQRARLSAIGAANLARFRRSNPKVQNAQNARTAARAGSPDNLPVRPPP